MTSKLSITSALGGAWWELTLMSFTFHAIPGYTYPFCAIDGISCRPTLLENSATWNHFCPVFRTLGERVPKKGSLHVQKPKKVQYITKHYSKEPKKVLKMVLKTNLEPFREHLNVPPVGQPKNFIF